MAMKRNTSFVIVLIALVGFLPILAVALTLPAYLHTENLAALPVRSMPVFEQQAQALGGLVIKPAYMLLSLVVILALTGQNGLEIRALWWGQVAFLAGEVFCAINFAIYQHESVISEYLHSYGMLVAFGLTFFALFEGLDRLMRLSSSKRACQALRVCGHCTRHESEGCKTKALARFTIPVFAVLTFIPLLTRLQPDAYAVSILGFPYSYARLDVYELYERRLLPVLGFLAFAIAYLPLWQKDAPPVPFITKTFVCIGLSALGFSFFRMTLNAIFVSDLVWFEFWEELTELMFVGALAFVLWTFRTTFLSQTRILDVIETNLK